MATIKFAEALTGTVTVVLGSETTVTGTGTAFLTETKAGEVLKIGSESRRIASVTSDTVLTVTKDFTPVADSTATVSEIPGFIADADLGNVTLVTADDVHTPEIRALGFRTAGWSTFKILPGDVQGKVECVIAIKNIA